MTYSLFKTQSILLTVFICTVTALLGCSNQNQSVPSKAPPSTLENILSMTVTPTFTHEPVNTLWSTPTLTPLSTMEPSQAKDALRRLLMDQMLCESPCFWGIIPNQTTLVEAQNIYNSLGLRLQQTFQDGGKVFYATSFGLENGVVTSIVLRVQNDLIDSIRTNIGFANYNGSSPLQEALAFSPKTVQSQYGIPTHVEFYISRAPSDGSSLYTISYMMIMYFDSSDLSIEYQSKPIKDEKIIRVCPLTDSFEGISVWHGQDAKDAPTREGVPIERAASLTLEQFGGLITREPNNACFELNTENFR